MLFQGEKLRKLRKDKGMMLTKTAELIGITFQHLSAIESGRKYPKEETVNKISKVFHIHPNYFYLADAILLTDIDGMPDDIKVFMANSENIPYIKISEKAKNAGISPDDLDQIIKIIISHK